jgi:acetylornithine/succinyldiaminopimelate/putrescine aminotransferase
LTAGQGIRATCEKIVRDKIPNLLRLYLNPYVAQACYCLTHLVESAWPSATAENYQVFLANSLEEALSGAIKLARYTASLSARSTDGLFLDSEGRLEHFAETELPGNGTIHYIPGVATLASAKQVNDWLSDNQTSPCFVVGFLSTLQALDSAAIETLCAPISSPTRPLLIVCVDRVSLASGEKQAADHWRAFLPDIVVFDESFVENAVPLGAFAARKQLYRHWNRRRMATFHSTTFQPNTTSSLHFMRCLENHSPHFVDHHAVALKRIEDDLKYRGGVYRESYSPSLANLVSAVNLDQASLRATGHYVEARGKCWFDAVAGVACSIRGHNPPGYVQELDQTSDIDDCRDETAQRLRALTGLPHFVPAVSGASAVEQALKIALASQFPRSYVLALRGGFGGKTLLALTGTWKASLKTGLAPLYPNVVYVDAFAENAVEALERACKQLPIAVIQFELIQGVGGVRALPRHVLTCLNRLRQQHGCLLFADEIQTGFYRTGPFARSSEAGVQPDLLTIGKGASDMMFPFAMTLYSESIRQVLDERGCSLPQVIRDRYSYELGIRTVLSTLRRAEQDCLSEKVRTNGRLFATLLEEQLIASKLAREARSFGMLVGIELDVRSAARRWMKRTLPRCVLLALMNQPTFPLIAGFCQYEPHVLKLTPPLTITEDEIRSVCAALASVLQLPLRRLAASGVRQAIIRPWIKRLCSM